MRVFIVVLLSGLLLAACDTTAEDLRLADQIAMETCDMMDRNTEYGIEEMGRYVSLSIMAETGEGDTDRNRRIVGMVSRAIDRLCPYASLN